MQYINLGKSGLKVSCLCLGMMTHNISKWYPWVLNEGKISSFKEAYQPHPVSAICSYVP